MNECVLREDPDASPDVCQNNKCIYIDSGACLYKQHKNTLLECGDMRSIITMLAKSNGIRRIEIKEELHNVRLRMKLDRMCEDFCGRSLLDARPSDIEQVRVLAKKEPNAEELLSQIDVCLNLIKEYEE